MSGRRGDPLLLTPGPLTTSRAVKTAMLHDWGSRDEKFIAMNRGVCERLLVLANATESHVAVPIQGSGTFAVEAMLGTFVPPGGRVLVLVNGAYGRRMVEICRAIGRDAVVYETAEDTPPDPALVARHLADDTVIGDVVLVHCETTSGILNPVADVATVVAAAGRRLLLDSMSAFGALPIDAAKIPFAALAASANKCLQGVPGARLRDRGGPAPRRVRRPRRPRSASIWRHSAALWKRTVSGVSRHRLTSSRRWPRPLPSTRRKVASPADTRDTPAIARC